MNLIILIVSGSNVANVHLRSQHMVTTSSAMFTWKTIVRKPLFIIIIIIILITSATCGPSIAITLCY